MTPKDSIWLSIASVMVLSPLFALRCLHYFLTRIVFLNYQACKDLNDFYTHFKANITMVEIRPGRRIAVLDYYHANSSTKGGKSTPMGKPMMFFVHGSCARMGQFDHLIRYFSEQRGMHVIAYDALGCFSSEKPNVHPYVYSTPSLYLDMVQLFSEKIKKYEPSSVTIVGHSMGANMIIRYVTSLTVSDSQKCIIGAIGIAALNISMGNEMVVKAKKVFGLPPPVVWLLRPVSHHKFRHLFFGKKASPRLIAMESESSSRNPVFMFRSYYTQIDPTALSIEDSKGGWSGDIVLISGGSDKICPYTKDNVNLLVSKGFMATDHVIPDTGHQIMEESPDEVIALINDFINSRIKY